MTSVVVQPATEGVEVRNSVEAPGTFFVVKVSFVVVLFGFIFSFSLWFVSLCVLGTVHCAFECSTVNCPLFVAELFDHIAVKDIEHVCTRKSRIFSFCEGLSGF